MDKAYLVVYFGTIFKNQQNIAVRRTVKAVHMVRCYVWDDSIKLKGNNATWCNVTGWVIKT